MGFKYLYLTPEKKKRFEDGPLFVRISKTKRLDEHIIGCLIF